MLKLCATKTVELISVSDVVVVIVIVVAQFLT